MHLNSKLLFQKYAINLFKDNINVLEIGPAGYPTSYQGVVNNDTITWETIDIFPSDKLTYVATNEYTFPIPDNTFDIVLSGQVIEHVRKTWVWIKEVSRVCKIGGHVITINPVSWPYHEAPIDCWRIYPEGMKALYEEANLVTELSVAETLEVDASGCIFPYHSRLPGTPRKKAHQVLGDIVIKKLALKPVFIPSSSYAPVHLSKIYGFLGLPKSCAVDTITIGVKK